MPVCFNTYKLNVVISYILALYQPSATLGYKILAAAIKKIHISRPLVVMKIPEHSNMQIRWRYKIHRAFGVSLLDFIGFACFHHFYFYFVQRISKLNTQSEWSLSATARSWFNMLNQPKSHHRCGTHCNNSADRWSMMDRLWPTTGLVCHGLQSGKKKIKNSNLSKK